MEKCKICGAKLNEGTSVCPSCGANVTDGTAGQGTTAPVSMIRTTCPSCGAEVIGEPRFCDKCGANLKEAAGQSTSALAPQERRCPQCGSILQTNSAFYPDCGAKLNEVAEEKNTVPQSQEQEHPSYGNDAEVSTSKSTQGKIISPKSRKIAMLLGFLSLPLFVPMHCFYVGKHLIGFIRLALFILSAVLNPKRVLEVWSVELAERLLGTYTPISSKGGALILLCISLWNLVDFIVICVGKYKDKDGAVLKSRRKAS